MRRMFMWLIVGLVGCPNPAVQGDEVMGVFSLHAEIVGNGGCDLAEVSKAPFDFEATFSHQTDSGVAYVTLAGYSRDGSFDGQYLSSVASAQRVFSECTGCLTRVVEQIDLSIFSRSQADVVALACPGDALTGGTPAVDPDAGIRGPGQTSSGFDAVLACGTLATHIEVDDGGTCDPSCYTCANTFTLSGRRK
jgi:hypothetical protein